MSCKPFSWDRRSTQLLITSYECYPNMYNTNSTSYKMKNKRMESLEAIRSDLLANSLDIPIFEITKKIHGLRTQFFKELTKVKKSYGTGTSPKDIYSPKLWCYEMLKFLINSDPVRNSESNLQHFPEEEQEFNLENMPEIIIDNGDIIELQEEIIPPKTRPKPLSDFNGNNNNTDNLTTPTQKLKTGKPILQNEAANLLKSASEVLNNYSNNKVRDDTSVFGEMIAAELRKVDDEDELRNAKRDMMERVFSAQEKSKRKKNS